jgi:predicted PurR-regulated permease PerM
LLNNKNFIRLANIALILLIIFLVSKVNYIFTPFKKISNVLLLPIIISIFLYYALRPLVRFLQRKKINKSIAIIMTLLFLILCLTLVIYLGGSAVKDQFVNSLTGNTGAVEFGKNLLDSSLGKFISDTAFLENILQASRQFIVQLSSNIFVVFSAVGNIGTQVLLVPFILFYFLKEDRKFAEGFIAILPEEHKKNIRELLKQIDSALTVYISGQLMVALIIGVLMFIGYLIIGMPNALFMGFFAMITSIIPFIGPLLGIVPALLIAITLSGGMLIKVAITAIIVQQVEGNLITPNIMGNKLNVHPLSVILIIIISVTLFGVLGAFVAIPVYVVLTITIKNLYNTYKRV